MSLKNSPPKNNYYLKFSNAGVTTAIHNRGLFMEDLSHITPEFSFKKQYIIMRMMLL